MIWKLNLKNKILKVHVNGVFIFVLEKDKDQLLFMFKTNHKPLTRFTYNSGSIVTKSKKTLSEILSNTMEGIEELKTIEKNINDEK